MISFCLRREMNAIFVTVSCKDTKHMAVVVDDKVSKVLLQGVEVSKVVDLRRATHILLDEECQAVLTFERRGGWNVITGARVGP